VDTGTSLMYVSVTDYNGFVSQIAHLDIDCTSDANEPYCYSDELTCDSFVADLPDLTFQINNVKYTIPPEGYTLSNVLRHECVIAISWMTDDSGLYILGDSFLRNFVSTYDFKNNEVVLMVNPNAPAGVLIEEVVS